MSETKQITEVGKSLGRSVAMDGALLKTPPKPAVNKTIANGTTIKANQSSKAK